MKLKKYIASMLTIGALVGIGVWYAIKTPGEKINYKTARIQRGDIIQTSSANGTLNPVTLVSVGTQVSGTVEKLYVDYNDKVKEGQALARLDQSLFDAQIAQSDANIKSAKASLELALSNEKRMRELYEKEFVSKQELDQSVKELKKAKAELSLYEAGHSKDMINKGYSIIKSPTSGVVIDRQIDVGQTVAASFQTPTLFKIAKDLRQMQIDSSFAEADIGRIKVGQEVSFNVDAYGDRTFSGVVKQIRLNATTQSNVVTYNVVVSVDNPEEILMPGMTAYVNIKTAEQRGVLLVPNAALRYKPSDLPKDGKPKDEQKQMKKNAQKNSGGKMATIYVLSNNELKPIRVKAGITDNRYTQIVSDELKEGDVAAVEDNQKEQSQIAKPPRMF